MPWSGYIDILGTRAAAERGLTELTKHTLQFHAAIGDFYSDFDPGTLTAFSDGAFFTTDDLNKFSTFYRRVRNQLLDKCVYFKCSLVAGRIGVNDALIIPKGYREKPNNFTSIDFSGEAARAYQKETMLKGIGCVVDLVPPRHVQAEFNNEEMALSVPDEFNRLLTKRTFFLKRDENDKMHPERYSDIKFAPAELMDQEEGESAEPGFTVQPIVDTSLFSCHEAILQQDHDSEKYVSLFSNMIRSSDLSKLRHEKGKWINSPYVFDRLMLSRGADQSISRLPGLKFLLLALFDQYYHDTNEDMDKTTVLAFARAISKRRDCVTYLASVPDFVLDTRARHQLVSAIAQVSGLKRK